MPRRPAVGTGGGRRPALEVERWDSAGAKAEVWIRLDSVPAANAEAWLFAGHAGPAPAAAPAFDTAAGFAGVWHMQRLDRNVADTASAFPDAICVAVFRSSLNVPDTSAAFVSRTQRYWIASRRPSNVSSTSGPPWSSRRTATR